MNNTSPLVGIDPFTKPMEIYMLLQLLSSSRAANASTTPWSISLLSCSSVTEVVGAVIVAGVDLVANEYLFIGTSQIRARRFIQRTGRKLDVNGQRVGFNRTKVECYNFHKNGHFERECRAPRNQENRGIENNRRTVTVETPTKNALITQDGTGGYDWSYQAEEEHPTNYALMAYTSLGSSSSSDSEVDSCSKSCVLLSKNNMIICLQITKGLNLI
ncbi:ribonuclease H-like domain-containing protein [Tanacetum coccineum]